LTSSPDAASARLFVALELPEGARDALVGWRTGVVDRVSGLRLVGPDDLHATLCFLGARPVGDIEQIAAASRVVAGEPTVETRFGESLSLPARRPRVLAVSLADPDGALARLQSVLSRELSAGGWYAPESRPFLAHVTVARVPRDARVRAVELPPPPGFAVRCSRVTLHRSRLSPGGARYEALASVELGSEPGAADPISPRGSLGDRRRVPGR
jgi:2'-5' RNA ligase